MLSEFRNAVSCRKSSRSRRRRPLGGAGGGVLRHPSRLALAGPRPVRLVRDMRFSNGKLYGGGGLRGVGGADLGPGPQKLLEEPVCVNATGRLTPPPPLPVAPLPPALVALPPPVLVAPPPPVLAAPPTLPRGFLQGCSHVRICQECRRIQNLRSTALTPPPPSSSSSTSSCSRGPSSGPRHRPCLHRHLHHHHHGSMSLPRLPPPPTPSPTDRADSDGGSGSPRRASVKPPPPPRPLPPPKTPPRRPTDLLGGHKGTAEGRGFKPSQI